MAEYQITLAETDVVSLLQRDGGFATLLTKVLNQVLEAQITDHLGAQPHERRDDRQGFVAVDIQVRGHPARANTSATRFNTTPILAPSHTLLPHFRSENYLATYG